MIRREVMKKSRFRKIIREEAKKVLKETTGIQIEGMYFDGGNIGVYYDERAPTDQNVRLYVYSEFDNEAVEIHMTEREFDELQRKINKVRM